jgi:hypothetical protein
LFAAVGALCITGMGMHLLVDECNPVGEMFLNTIEYNALITYAPLFWKVADPCLSPNGNVSIEKFILNSTFTQTWKLSRYDPLQDNLRLTEL